MTPIRMIDSTTNTQTVIILGMFRSGTSMVAGILDILGVDMGSDMLPESRANPLGYFEDRAFMDLNRTIVEAAGGTLNDPPPLSAIKAQEERFRAQLRSMAAPDAPRRWGWKDPVTSLTIHCYADHLVNPSLIVCRRDPEAVAASYAKMVEMSPSAVKELRAAYNRSIDEFINAHPDIPRLELCYDAFVNDPEAHVHRLIGFLGLEPSEAQLQEATDFVKPKREIRWLRLKSLVKKGLNNPADVPGYVLKRVRVALGLTNNG